MVEIRVTHFLLEGKVFVNISRTIEGQDKFSVVQMLGVKSDWNKVCPSHDKLQRAKRCTF